ncbi:MAG TPA: hypothetical protein VH302_09025 [Bryobacteraceae bacterium]|nr:hypothetical protein [Bryobacteraceae bacterium]
MKAEETGDPATAQRQFGNPTSLKERCRDLWAFSKLVNEVPSTAIGIMPPGKRFPEDTDLWTPLIPDTQMRRRATRSVTLFGRLKDGVSMASSRKEMNALAARLVKEYPETDTGLTAAVENIAEITGVYNSRPMFVALWLAVGFVLLIACAGVANMLLARGAIVSLAIGSVSIKKSGLSEVLSRFGQSRRDQNGKRVGHHRRCHH